MQATRIIAIRHGETAWNVGGRIQGHLDVGLNDTGRRQAARLAAALAQRDRVDLIVCSDLTRARDTAQAIAQATGVPLTPEPGLRERHFGAFQGRTFVELNEQHPRDAERWRRRDPDWTPPGGEGESLLMFQERILKIVHRLGAENVGGHLVLVTHGGVLDVLYRAATGQALQAPRTWQIGNAAINRLLWTPDGLTLVGWADDAHLQQTSLDESTT